MQHVQLNLPGAGHNIFHQKKGKRFFKRARATGGPGGAQGGGGGPFGRPIGGPWPPAGPRAVPFLALFFGEIIITYAAWGLLLAGPLRVGQPFAWPPAVGQDHN